MNARSFANLRGGLSLALFWVALTVVFARSYWFERETGAVWGVADDVYITADFARTFAEGGGPRWYEDAPKVEGFSSPLWLLCLAALHVLPGFAEERLGLFVLVLNAVGIALGAVLLVHCARRALELTSGSLGAWWPLWGAVVAASGASLAFFTAAGFEVTLVTVLSLLALAEALRSDMRPALLGLWLGLGIWTRMDAAIPCSAAVLVAMGRSKTLREGVAPMVVPAAMLVVLLAARRAYYGQWLPNTYTLKATGWAVSERLPQGFVQNLPALFGLLLLATALVPVWRSLGRTQRLVLAPVASHALAVAYSTWNGGDFAFEVLAYDRFTCVTAATAAAAVAVALAATSLRRSLRSVATVLAVLVFLLPLVGRPAPLLDRFVLRSEHLELHGLFSGEHTFMPREYLVHLWVRYGQALPSFTKPEAKVAVCAAGAIPYFSRRPAVDLLGKVDPLIAAQKARSTPPPDARCWRGHPGAGHNKENVQLSFRRRRPDVSMVPPPSWGRRGYRKVHVQGLDWWVLRDSEHVRWKRLPKERKRRRSR